MMIRIPFPLGDGKISCLWMASKEAQSGRQASKGVKKGVFSFCFGEVKLLLRFSKKNGNTSGKEEK